MKTRFNNVINILYAAEAVSKKQKEVSMSDIYKYVYLNFNSPSNYAALVNMINDIADDGYVKKDKQKHKSFITLTQKGKMLLNLAKATKRPHKKKSTRKKNDKKED